MSRLCSEGPKLTQLADLELVEVDIKKALEIEPDNRDVKLTYKTLKEKIKEINKKDAKFYSNMFSKMTKPTTEESVSYSASIHC